MTVLLVVAIVCPPLRAASFGGPVHCHRDKESVGVQEPAAHHRRGTPGTDCPGREPPVVRGHHNQSSIPEKTNAMLLF